MKNVNVYWDWERQVVGVTARFFDIRAEEPIAGRSQLSDADLLRLIDEMLSDSYLSEGRAP